MPTNLSSFFLFAAMTLVAVPSDFAQVITFNGDGAVNTNDLLGLLGYFGLPCEE